MLDGQALARAMQEEIRPEVAAFTAHHGRPPGLGIVLVGDNPASEVYVRNKLKAGADVGFRADLERLPASATVTETIALVERLNRSDIHDGILVQSPLPRAMGTGAEQRVFDAIAPDKDVDGLTPVSAGLLALGREGLRPCTPTGVMLLLEDAGARLEGAEAVVVGRSNLFGKPMAQLLLGANCTVTIAHSRTRDLPGVVRRADLVVAAVGRPEMVRGDWIKPGAIVIDVGMNRIAGSGGKHRLLGDVAYDEARAVAGAITPVPGGVGPMTIACLLQNTLRAADGGDEDVRPAGNLGEVARA